MILSGKQIGEEVMAGAITISPFSDRNLNSASYSYHLGQEIVVQQSPDSLGKREMVTASSADGMGMLLRPGTLYLSNTLEEIGSRTYVVLLSGRRSTAKLGLFVQLSANLGNLGDAHCWTLELSCVQPVVVYPGMLIGQVTFWRPRGPITLYSGPYTQHSRPVGNLRKFDRQ